MSPDLIEAARLALFAALEAAHAAAASGASVVDHVTQDEPAPFVWIDEIEWTNEGSKAEPLLKISADIVTLYRGENRAALTALMHINFKALNDVALSAAGVALRQCGLIAGAASGAPPDGVTYAGTQTFQLYAEAA